MANPERPSGLPPDAPPKSCTPHTSTPGSGQSRTARTCPEPVSFPASSTAPAAAALRASARACALLNLWVSEWALTQRNPGICSPEPAVPPRSPAPSAARPAERLGRSACFPGPHQAASPPPRNPELGAEARCSWAPGEQEAQPRDRTVHWCPAPSRIPPEPAALTEALWAPWLQSSLEAKEVSGRPERLGLWRLRPLSCVSTARGTRAPTRPRRRAGLPARGPAARAGDVVCAARPRGLSAPGSEAREVGRAS